MSLYLTVGNMGAGKSEALIDSNEEALESGIETIVFTPSQDTAMKGKVHGKRTGRSIETVTVSSVSDIRVHIYRMMRPATARVPKRIHIDEAHMLCSQYDRMKAAGLLALCVSLVEMYEAEVKVYSLDRDIRGYSLEPYRTVMASEVLSSIWAVSLAREGWCQLCGEGSKSEYSWLVEDLPFPIPGLLGIDYLGLCKSHFFELSSKRLELHAAGRYGVRLPDL